MSEKPLINVEVTDAFGLKEPLVKLFETITKGIGKVYAPTLIRKTADAKAYELKAIAEAISGVHGLTKQIEYVNGEITIKSLDAESIEDFTTLQERNRSREIFQGAKRHLNTESVIQQAAEFIASEDNVSNEPVDDDFINRFFNYVQDVSDEDIQKIWGKVLAGEVKQPKSFSLRTLDILRNMSKEDAKILMKLANLTIQISNQPLIFKENEKDELGSYYIEFNDLSSMIEAGIIYNDMTLHMEIIPLKKLNEDFFIVYGNLIVKIRRLRPGVVKQINIFKYTKSGEQIFKLLTTTPNHHFFRSILNNFFDVDFLVQYSEFDKKVGDDYTLNYDWETAFR